VTTEAEAWADDAMNAVEETTTEFETEINN